MPWFHIQGSMFLKNIQIIDGKAEDYKGQSKKVRIEI